MRLTFAQWLRLVLFLGGSLLATGIFLFAHWAIGRLSHEVTTTSRVLARFCAQASFPATSDPQLRSIFSAVIAQIDFPIVVTDHEGIPRAWRGVDVDPALVPAASIDSLAFHGSIAPVIAARIDRVREQIVELDRHNQPIPLTEEATGDTLGAVHYGEPSVLGLLRWVPFASAAGVMLLLGIGLWGLAIIRAAEKRTIWVGMAKETAHQLGTPLSSLMGWAELLRGHVERRVGDEVRMPASELRETVGEMERDLERLNKVTQRFSHIGSEPRLSPQEVEPIAREVAGYMRRRMPQNPDEVTLTERYAPAPAVNLNAELLAWALENLISNALSAIEQRPGRIQVVVEPQPDQKAVDIAVVDNGRGMSARERKRAFEPGYTTKRRGWGLGLALTRRVVEEYHAGRVFIRHSAPGAGTTVVIRLPVA